MARKSRKHDSRFDAPPPMSRREKVRRVVGGIGKNYVGEVYPPPAPPLNMSEPKITWGVGRFVGGAVREEPDGPGVSGFVVDVEGLAPSRAAYVYEQPVVPAAEFAKAFAEATAFAVADGPLSTSRLDRAIFAAEVVSSGVAGLCKRWAGYVEQDSFPRGHLAAVAEMRAAYRREVGWKAMKVLGGSLVEEAEAEILALEDEVQRSIALRALALLGVEFKDEKLAAEAAAFLRDRHVASVAASNPEFDPDSYNAALDKVREIL